MTRVRRVLPLAGVILLADLTACDEGLPTPGALQISLTTPNTGDAGILFRLTGEGMTDVGAASSNHDVHWRIVSSTEARILVMGNLTAGPIATVEVTDVDRSGTFSGSVLQVIDRGNTLRESLDGYDLSATRLDER